MQAVKKKNGYSVFQKSIQGILLGLFITVNLFIRSKILRLVKGRNPKFLKKRNRFFI